MRTYTLWTCLSPQALGQLLKTGTYRFQKAELDAKYGIAAEYCDRMYRWYTRTAGKFTSIPENCIYPIWMAPAKDRLLTDEQTPVFLKLDVPEGCVLRCNISAWEYRMGCRYIPTSTEDDLAHVQEMERWGAGNDEALINTHRGNFFPHLRMKIQNSWNRVFTQLNVVPGLIAFTAWELRKEWIEEIRMEVQPNSIRDDVPISLNHSLEQ